MTNSISRIQPGQFAALLLASGEALPRARARDQQSDLAGGQLKQQVLTRIVALDPDANDLLVTLDQIVLELGEPTGPTRAMARLIAEEWDSVNQNPQLARWLLDEAVQRGERRRS